MIFVVGRVGREPTTEQDSIGFDLQFLGATGEVTGSLYLLRTGTHTVLLECGLIQGSAEDEERNRDAWPITLK